MSTISDEDPRAFPLRMLDEFEREQGAQLTRLRQAIRAAVGLDPAIRGAPGQAPKLLVPGLEAKPFHAPETLPEARALTAAYPLIAAELAALRSRGAFCLHPDAHLIERGEWGGLHLFNRGQRFEDGARALPETARVVADIPGVTTCELVYLSALTEGARLRPHCGPHNCRLRIQLGLVTPTAAGICVAGETRSWRAGECLIVDDSFEHHAWNAGPGPRVVLIVDVWHPQLSQLERLALIRLRECYGNQTRSERARRASVNRPLDLDCATGEGAA